MKMKNLVENFRGNNIFKNSERKNNSEVGNFGCKNSVHWNHTNLILNWNQKYSDLIHVDPNHTDLNQPITADLSNIGSIHDSDSIISIEKNLESPVHYPVHASPIFTYGSANDPLLPTYDLSSESVTTKGNPNTCNNPTNPVPYIPDDPDSDPSLLYSTLSESSDS